MTCVQIEEMIQDYIDEQLSEEQVQTMKSHIDTCDACREYYDLMVEMVGSLNALEEVEVPEGLHQSIMDSVQAQMPLVKTKGKFNYRRFMKPAMSVVAAAFLLFVVFTVIQPNDMLEDSHSDMTTSESTSSKSFDSVEEKKSESNRSVDEAADMEMMDVAEADTETASMMVMEEPTTEDAAVEESYGDSDDTMADEGVEMDEVVQSTGSVDTKSDDKADMSTVMESNDADADAHIDEGTDDAVVESEPVNTAEVTLSESEEVKEEVGVLEADDEIETEEIKSGMNRIIVILALVLILPLILIIMFMVLRRKLK